MNFGVMFFSSAGQDVGEPYTLLKKAAHFADAGHFCCIWTPERHFHEFGGLFPNAAVTSAALAMMTSRLQIRAGSVIAPLHHPIRIAEEWAVVDNLSHGRVAISFGSGWNVNDFIFFPDRYRNRQAVMYEQIRTIQKLWSGESIVAENGAGKPMAVSISPRPVQARLPIWLTSSGNADTFVSAGTLGANLLTHLLAQDLATLQSKIGLYREARAAHGFDPQTGIVSLMLHTFVGITDAEVRAAVREPFGSYLKSALGLEIASGSAGGVISGGRALGPERIEGRDLNDLIEAAFERHYNGGALMGTPDVCVEFVRRLQAIGVDEIACLIDFGVDTGRVMESLQLVDDLCVRFSSASASLHSARIADFAGPLTPESDEIESKPAIL
jgi:natural product biosynthesis luciferase-like monooxygenase protein